MRREGRSQAEIGRRLGVERQGINEAFHIIDEKMRQALKEAALINKLEAKRLDPLNGILEAYSQAYDVPVIVSYSKTNGVQVWYLYEGRCRNCNRNATCLTVLKAEAEERGIRLTEEDLRLPPTQLGRKIFSIVTKYAKEGE